MYAPRSRLPHRKMAMSSPQRRWQHRQQRKRCLGQRLLPPKTSKMLKTTMKSRLRHRITVQINDCFFSVCVCAFLYSFDVSSSILLLTEAHRPEHPTCFREGVHRADWETARNQDFTEKHNGTRKRDRSGGSGSRFPQESLDWYINFSGKPALLCSFTHALYLSRRQTLLVSGTFQSNSTEF
jgi:hypothetical protein